MNEGLKMKEATLQFHRDCAGERSNDVVCKGVSSRCRAV